MNEWKQYRKTATQEMRPYVLGEDLSGISVSEEDTLEIGGMIARNAKNHNDQWYVAKRFFLDSYELAADESHCPCRVELRAAVKRMEAEIERLREGFCSKCGSISGICMQLCDDCMTRVNKLEAKATEAAGGES